MPQSSGKARSRHATRLAEVALLARLKNTHRVASNSDAHVEDRIDRPAYVKSSTSHMDWITNDELAHVVSFCTSHSVLSFSSVCRRTHLLFKLEEPFSNMIQTALARRMGYVSVQDAFSGLIQREQLRCVRTMSFSGSLAIAPKQHNVTSVDRDVRKFLQATARRPRLAKNSVASVTVLRVDKIGVKSGGRKRKAYEERNIVMNGCVSSSDLQCNVALLCRSCVRVYTCRSDDASREWKLAWEKDFKGKLLETLKEDVDLFEVAVSGDASAAIVVLANSAGRTSTWLVNRVDEVRELDAMLPIRSASLANRDSTQHMHVWFACRSVSTMEPAMLCNFSFERVPDVFLEATTSGPVGWLHACTSQMDASTNAIAFAERVVSPISDMWTSHDGRTSVTMYFQSKHEPDVVGTFVEGMHSLLSEEPRAVLQAWRVDVSDGSIHVGHLAFDAPFLVLDHTSSRWGTPSLEISGDGLTVTVCCPSLECNLLVSVFTISGDGVNKPLLILEKQRFYFCSNNSSGSHGFTVHQRTVSRLRSRGYVVCWVEQTFCDEILAESTSKSLTFCGTMLFLACPKRSTMLQLDLTGAYAPLALHKCDSSLFHCGRNCMASISYANRYEWSTVALITPFDRLDS